MARVRKPLKMADGHVIQHIDEFKEHFDLENMLGHYESGRLAAWLESYFYDGEVETLKSLDREAADFQEKFCKLFGVEYESPVDQAKIVEREKRLIKLKGLTADETVHQHVDYVAFDQGELADRLDEGCTKIYLCSADGRKFTVPASRTGVKYIGVNNPQAHISGKQSDPLGVMFTGVEVDNLSSFMSEGLDILQETTKKSAVLVKIEKRRVFSNKLMIYKTDSTGRRYADFPVLMLYESDSETGHMLYQPDIELWNNGYDIYGASVCDDYVYFIADIGVNTDKEEEYENEAYDEWLDTILGVDKDDDSEEYTRLQRIEVGSCLYKLNINGKVPDFIGHTLMDTTLYTYPNGIIILPEQVSDRSFLLSVHAEIFVPKDNKLYQCIDLHNLNFWSNSEFMPFSGYHLLSLRKCWLISLGCTKEYENWIMYPEHDKVESVLLIQLSLYHNVPPRVVEIPIGLYKFSGDTPEIDMQNTIRNSFCVRESDILYWTRDNGGKRRFSIRQMDDSSHESKTLLQDDYGAPEQHYIKGHPVFTCKSSKIYCQYNDEMCPTFLTGLEITQ